MVLYSSYCRGKRYSGPGNPKRSLRLRQVHKEIYCRILENAFSRGERDEYIVQRGIYGERGIMTLELVMLSADCVQPCEHFNMRYSLIRIIR